MTVDPRVAATIHGHLSAFGLDLDVPKSGGLRSRELGSRGLGPRGLGPRELGFNGLGFCGMGVCGRGLHLFGLTVLAFGLTASLVVGNAFAEPIPADAVAPAVLEDQDPGIPPSQPAPLEVDPAADTAAETGAATETEPETDALAQLDPEPETDSDTPAPTERVLAKPAHREADLVADEAPKAPATDSTESPEDIVEEDIVEEDIVEEDIVEGDLIEGDLVAGDLIVENVVDEDVGTKNVATEDGVFDDTAEEEFATEPEVETEPGLPVDPELTTDPVEPESRPPFEILGITVPSGETRRFEWSGLESFAGRASMTPVLIAHGTRPGPTLCVSAAVHGDELNGIEIVRRFMEGVDPRQLAGTVVGVPIVNVYGFQRGSRYLPDRRDLNRFFPGDPRGSSASRIAHMFFQGIIRRCDRLVDVHTGSFHRSNLTQLRADISQEGVRELCTGFGKIPVLHNVGSPGTLRRAATDAGIPAVTIEAGEPMRLDPNVVEVGVAGLRELLANTKMIDVFRLFSVPQPLFYRSTWVRADSGGILFALVSLGQEVTAGERLATVTDPLTNEQTTVISPYSGTVLGMAVNQFVMPGFAVIRIGIETSSNDVRESSPPSTLGQDLSDEQEVPLEPHLDLEERPE